MFAELRIGLRHDLESSPKPIEIVDVERAEIDLHGLEQVLQWHTLRLGLDAIDFCVELRHVYGESREQSSQAGGLIAFADDCLCVLCEGVVALVAAILDEHLESANGPEAIHRRRR